MELNPEETIVITKTVLTEEPDNYVSSKSVLTENSNRANVSSKSESESEDSDNEDEDDEDDKSVSAEKKVVSKQKWLLIEDARLKELVKLHGEDWPVISSNFSNRTRKQCRER